MVGGGLSQMVAGEICPTNRWDTGSWPPKTGGRREVSPPKKTKQVGDGTERTERYTECTQLTTTLE